MSDDDPLIIPVGGGDKTPMKWVAVAALIAVASLGSFLLYQSALDSRKEQELAAAKVADEKAQAERRAEQRKKAASGTPLSEAHKPPPGYKPPKQRIPSKDLFSAGGLSGGGVASTRLPGGLFGVELPPKWESSTIDGLFTLSAPENHFRIIAVLGTNQDDRNTKRALEAIGAVNCNWQQGDGPKNGHIGSQRIPAFFNEGMCGHTDGYGLIWMVRLFAGEQVVSLVARYASNAGDDAEDKLIAVLKSVIPIDGK